jgi:protein TonB
MFADSMLETSWDQRSRRSWTTLSSFGLQALVVGILLIVPLVRPVALPFLRPLATPVSLAVPPGPPPVAHQQQTTAPVQSNLSNNVLIAPREIPRQILNVAENIAPPQIGPVGPYVQGSTGSGGDPSGVLGSLGTPGSAILPQPPRPVVAQPRISHMMEGNLIYRTQPEYPFVAKSAHIQGQVRISAIISKEGTIENLHVIAGPPLLVHAAVEAVTKWRYRPYILNNEPVEVETQIVVNFSLSGN